MQTKIGAAKARDKNLAKNPNYFREIGARGGAVKGVRKGFAIDNRTWLDKLLRKPSRASLSGTKGGHISKRVKRV